MWIYHQISGAMVRPDGSLLENGYSGQGQGKNDPNAEAIHNLGPIPKGAYSIALIDGPDGEPIDYEGKKHPVMRLLPKPGTNDFGRAGFLIHGDFSDPELRGTASHGCIILSHNSRIEVNQSEDKDLEVIA